MGMQFPILGVVLHTTNHKLGEESITRFRDDWQAKQFQSAHFIIDRTGQLGQCRGVTEVAWHIGKPSARYIGVEHIAKLDASLTGDQVDASGNAACCPQ
jgi:N-acetyl-anhydromuramyl-L-alanine amidase AmpD